MPSSHTQFMFFLAAFVALFLRFRLRSRPTALLSARWIAVGKALAALGTYGVAATVAVSRV